jgi:hypothetical protein
MKYEKMEFNSFCSNFDLSVFLLKNKLFCGFSGTQMPLCFTFFTRFASYCASKPLVPKRGQSPKHNHPHRK